jgi:ABC-2 type transport system ATP-binding protein/lipopolysaccharide transport system ATP-binding protein
MADILLKNITLDFPIYGASTRSFKKRLLRATTGGLIKQTESSVITVRALNNLNLHIEHGDRVGIIGHNGAGKSTLLRVLAGIYEPIIGEMIIEGKVTALLNVMMGLDQESTGLENIKLCGILNGLTFETIEKNTKAIADFTDLGDYLSMPIRTYSSGMQLRLAFAIATAIEPEILILDEVVGVGDTNFIEKARARMLSIIHTSNIVIIASHDRKILTDICNKVIVMNAGEISFYGPAKEGIEFYDKKIHKKK